MQDINLAFDHTGAAEIPQLLPGLRAPLSKS